MSKMEIWDLYDRDRHLVSEKLNRGDAMPDGRYHLVVHVCIFNKKGELLIQQRQKDKEGWPNLWDVSVGGSALAGEDSRAAAVRETKEELGLDIDLKEERPKMTLNFKYGFDDYWMIEKDVKLSELMLQAEEVQAVRWVNQSELMALVNSGKFIPYIFIDKIFDIFRLEGAIVEKEVRI